MFQKQESPLLDSKNSKPQCQAHTEAAANSTKLNWVFFFPPRKLFEKAKSLVEKKYW